MSRILKVVLKKRVMLFIFINFILCIIFVNARVVRVGLDIEDIFNGYTPELRDFMLATSHRMNELEEIKTVHLIKIVSTILLFVINIGNYIYIYFFITKKRDKILLYIFISNTVFLIVCSMFTELMKQKYYVSHINLMFYFTTTFSAQYICYVMQEIIVGIKNNFKVID